MPKQRLILGIEKRREIKEKRRSFTSKAMVDRRKWVLSMALWIHDTQVS
jgi:hypothetical protein